MINKRASAHAPTRCQLPVGVRDNVDDDPAASINEEYVVVVTDPALVPARPRQAVARVVVDVIARRIITQGDPNCATKCLIPKGRAPPGSVTDIAVLVAIVPPMIAAPIASGVASVSEIFQPRPVRVAAVVADLTRLAAAIITVHFTPIVAVSPQVVMIRWVVLGLSPYWHEGRGNQPCQNGFLTELVHSLNLSDVHR